MALAVISAADPLNLGGIITAGVKTPARAGNRILLADGEPVARLIGEEIEVFDHGRRIPGAEIEQRLRVVRPFHADARRAGRGRAR